MNGGLPQMKVKEKNGEISATVADTDRIRAQLGLKPLKVEYFSSLHAIQYIL